MFPLQATPWRRNRRAHRETPAESQRLPRCGRPPLDLLMLSRRLNPREAAECRVAYGLSMDQKRRLNQPNYRAISRGRRPRAKRARARLPNMTKRTPARSAHGRSFCGEQGQQASSNELGSTGGEIGDSPSRTGVRLLFRTILPPARKRAKNFQSKCQHSTAVVQLICNQ